MCQHRGRASMRSQRWFVERTWRLATSLLPVRKAPKLAEEDSNESSIL